jgi:hypothetical protein
VRVLAAYNVPPPMAQTLEVENLPTAAKTLANIKEMLGR